jgi:hypothetical protein
LWRNNRIIDGVDEDHGLVDAVPVVDARHLRVHLLKGFVAEQLSKKRKKKIYLLILVFQFLSQISTSFAKPTMSFKNIVKLKAKVRLSLNVLFAFKTTVKLY